MLTIDTAYADLGDSEFMLKELNAQEEREVNTEKNEMEVAANDMHSCQKKKEIYQC